MKVLTAIDSFKGSFTSEKANQKIAEAFSQSPLVEEVIQVAIADGGEGTIRSLTKNLGGEILSIDTVNLVGKPIKAQMGWLKEKQWAIIEAAEVVSIQFLDESQTTHPTKTNSYGLGILIKEALSLGAKKIIIGLGGTGTIDLGWGVAAALGVQVLNGEGQVISPYPQSFFEANALDLSKVDQRINQADIILLNDVNNPLLGKQGVVQMFGSQKGLLENEFAEFEKNAAHFATLINSEDSQVAGDGAAGGIGFMLRSLFHGRYESGFFFIADSLNLKELVKECDLVITGEGRLDEQSLIGKVPVGMAKLAKSAGIPCIAFTGQDDLSRQKAQQAGFAVIIPIVNEVMSLTEAMATGSDNLQKAAQRIIDVLTLGSIYLK